jgi:hypothetical protein
MNSLRPMRLLHQKVIGCQIERPRFGLESRTSIHFRERGKEGNHQFPGQREMDLLLMGRTISENKRSPSTSQNRTTDKKCIQSAPFARRSQGQEEQEEQQEQDNKHDESDMGKPRRRTPDAVVIWRQSDCCIRYVLCAGPYSIMSTI